MAKKKGKATPRTNRALVLPAIMPYACIFAVSMLCSLVVHIAYPYGVVTFETLAYLWLAKGFLWFDVNMVDWYRTVPYGWVLLFSKQFSAPTAVVYWLHSLLFATCTCFTLRLFIDVTKSLRLGWIIAGLLLLYEVVSMRLFYMNIFMTTDAFYAEVLWAGILLTLIGWWEGRTSWLIAGYAVFGLCTVIRPVGVVLIPVWGIAGLLLFLRQDKFADWQLQWRGLCIAIMLMLLPSALWATRNKLVYNTFAVSTLGPHELLVQALPLLRDGDIVFDDPRVNKEFIATVRYQERAYGKGHNDYSWGGGKNNDVGIFQFFERFTPTYAAAGERQMDWVEVSRTRFEMAPALRFAAKRLIGLHPGEFTARVMKEYMVLYSPFHVFQTGDENPNTDPHMTYAGLAATAQFTDIMQDMYPPDGKVNVDALSKTSQVARNIVVTVCCSLFGTLVRSIPSPTGAIAAHIVFLLSIAMLAYTKDRRVLWMMILLFLTVAAHYMATALTEASLYRYTLPGLPLLHLFYALGAISAAPLLTRRR